MNYDTVVIRYTLKRTEEGSVYDIILKKSHGVWLMTGSTGGGCICSDGQELSKEIVESDVLSLMKSLEALSVTPLVIHENAVESGFEELSIQNGLFKSTFIWDADNPCEYRELQKLCRVLQCWVKNRA